MPGLGDVTPRWNKGTYTTNRQKRVISEMRRLNRHFVILDCFAVLASRKTWKQWGNFGGLLVA